MKKIKIELLKGGIMPKKEFPESAGYDLFMPERVEIKRGRQRIPLGFKIALSKRKTALIFARSGVQAKGVKGFLSESNGVLCNVKVSECVVTKERLEYLYQNDDLYFVDRIKKIENEVGKDEMYAVVCREKVFDPIRLERCSIELGMIDCGFRGEVCLIVDNQDVNFYIEKGESVAQMLIINKPAEELERVEALDAGEGERGEQGFNS